MKTIRIISMSALAIAVLATGAAAQKRTRKPAPKPQPTPNTFASSLEVRTVKVTVSNQVENLTRFTSALGPIAAAIEAADREPPTKRLTQINDANKQKVRKQITDFREGLVRLETEFRTKAGLRKFLPKVDGITLLSTEAEDLANAGKFTESRRPLLTVLQKLSDTLAILK